MSDSFTPERYGSDAGAKSGALKRTRAPRTVDDDDGNDNKGDSGGRERYGSDAGAKSGALKRTRPSRRVEDEGEGIIDKSHPGYDPDRGSGGGSQKKKDTGPSRRELRGRARTLHPWLPEELLSVFVDAWIETGSPQQALAEMRQSGEYERNFPAIFRDDGTMRMGEREYLATRAQMEQHVASYDVNPERFQSHITRAIEGEQSPDELRGRLSAMWGRVLDNADAVRQEFGRHYSIDDLSDSALFASALDPELGQDVLNRRIDVAEVAGGFRDAAWQRSENRIRDLMNEGVEGFGQARSLARQITRRSENLSVLGRRHNEGDFSRRDVEEATVFEDQGEQRRIKRTMAAEQSLFSPSARFRQDESGALSGLRQR